MQCLEPEFFHAHIMCLYSQIGYLYGHSGLYHAAADYFKKQLILSWQQGNLSNEIMAYESLSLCYYYMDNEAENMRLSMIYQERASRGLIEEDTSQLKQTWVVCQNQRDEKIVQNLRTKHKAQKEEQLKKRQGGRYVPPKNREIMAQRKGFERKNV